MAWFANFLLNTATQIAGVTNMIGALIMAIISALLGVVIWHRSQRSKGKTGVEPAHLVIAGLVGVIIFAALGMSGIVWGKYWTAPTAELSRPDTRLRLRLDPAGTRNYLQDAESNISNWQQTIVAMDAHDDKKQTTPIIHADTFSMTFVQPVDYERPVIESFGHKLGGFNFYSLGTRGAVFQFYDAVQAPMIEIWFPPIGYYAEQSKKSAIGVK